MAVLSIDIGASALKAGLVAADGRVLALAQRACPVGLSPDGASEIDVAAWIAAADHAVSSALTDAPAEPVDAIAITGMTRTQVLVDGEGRALRPAITWRDTRAGALAARVGRLGAETLDAFHPAARLLWLAQTEPDVVARAAAVLDPKDALAAHLTGAVASDAVALARLLAAAEGEGAPRRLVPPLKRPGEILGHVRDGPTGAFARLGGCPVALVSHDTWAAVAGMGALRPGLAYQLSGTSDVAGVIADRPIAADGLMAVPWGEGLHQLGGPSQNGADTIAWALELLGVGHDPSALDRLLSGARHGKPALFLPFLAGERVPHWDADLRGAFLGLARTHGPGDIAWGVVEGQALAGRAVLRRAESALGRPVEEVRFAGGPSRNPTLCRLRANAIGRRVVTTGPEPGLVGAAMCGFVALGRYTDIGAALAAMARPAATYEPDPAEAARYDELVTLFDRAVDATRALSHALARF